MLEPVPGGVDPRLAEAMGAREVDDDAASRRVDRRRPLVRKTDEDDVGAARESCLVRDESRHAAPAVAAEPGVEGSRRLPGERVGSQRVQVQRRVREHAVERLLTRVPGGADDGDGGHLAIMHV